MNPTYADEPSFGEKHHTQPGEHVPFLRIAWIHGGNGQMAQWKRTCRQARHRKPASVLLGPCHRLLSVGHGNLLHLQNHPFP